MRRQIPHPTPHHPRFSACMYIRYALLYFPPIYTMFYGPARLNKIFTFSAASNEHFLALLSFLFSDISLPLFSSYLLFPYSKSGANM